MTKFYSLTKLLAAAMFKKDSPIIADGAIPKGSRPWLLLSVVRKLVADRKINEAENLIFDNFDIKMPVYAAIALEFYARISEFSEEELISVNFSVDEIGEGIADMMNFYKIKLVKKPMAENANAKSAAPNVLADKPQSL